MNIRKSFLIALCLQITIVAAAQTNYQSGVLPAVNLNGKLKNDWSVNFKTESRQLFKKEPFNGDSDNEYEYVLTDLTTIFSKEVGLNSRLSGGYLLRLPNGKPVHRSIQQFAVTQKKAGFRLSHRVVTDQTFSTTESPAFRLRYRLTSEIPLNGQSVDINEFYLKINNEYLNSLQDTAYDLEVRLVPFLGYAISDIHKVEAGLDYRVNSFLDDKTRHTFWMSLNWYVDI